MENVPAHLATPVITAENWQRFAACVMVVRLGAIEYEDFFGDNNTKEGRLNTERARAVCLGCAAIDFCLADTMGYPIMSDLGVRGGMAASEREKARKDFKQVTPAVAPIVRARFSDPAEGQLFLRAQMQKTEAARARGGRSDPHFFVGNL